MAEYIDREALENAMTIAAVNGKEKDRRTWAKAICVLHDMQTADVAPVVRCKDCKWFIKNNNDEWWGCWLYHTINVIPEDAPKPDDFCSYMVMPREKHKL